MKKLDSELENIWQICCEIWFDLTGGQQLAIKSSQSTIPSVLPSYEVVTIENNNLQVVGKLENLNSISECIKRTLYHLINSQVERKTECQRSLDELRLKIEKKESEINDIEIDLTVLSSLLEKLNEQC